MSDVPNLEEGQRGLGGIEEYEAPLTSDDFAESTKTIRTWIAGGGVNVRRLVAELRYYADWFDDGVDPDMERWYRPGAEPTTFEYIGHAIHITDNNADYWSVCPATEPDAECRTDSEYLPVYVRREGRRTT